MQKIRITKSNSKLFLVGDEIVVHRGENGRYVVSKSGSEEALKHLYLSGVFFVFC